MKTYQITNLIIVAFTIIGLGGSYKNSKFSMFIYYTILSNFLAFLTGILVLLFGQNSLISVLRYTATVMLTITCLITLFVLVPTIKKPKALLLGENLFNHILVPIVSLVSYVFFEEQNSLIVVPVMVSVIYGVITLILNIQKKLEGPYPFLMVYKQSKMATVIWMISLPIFIAGISALIGYLAIIA